MACLPQWPRLCVNGTREALCGRCGITALQAWNGNPMLKLTFSRTSAIVLDFPFRRSAHAARVSAWWYSSEVIKEPAEKSAIELHLPLGTRYFGSPFCRLTCLLLIVFATLLTTVASVVRINTCTTKALPLMYQIFPLWYAILYI